MARVRTKAKPITYPYSTSSDGIAFVKFEGWGLDLGNGSRWRAPPDRERVPIYCWMRQTGSVERHEEAVKDCDVQKPSRVHRQCLRRRHEGNEEYLDKGTLPSTRPPMPLDPAKSPIDSPKHILT